MKAIRNLFLLLILVFFASCSHNQEMLTVIQSDGSCYRQFSAKVDSAFLSGDTSEDHNSFPVLITSDWEILDDSLDNFISIRRRYSSVNKLSEEFAWKPDFDWADMKVEYNFSKKFRWFYTYYTYTETYPKIKADFELPIEDYLTPDELSFWLTGTPDLTQGMNGIEISAYISDLDEKYNTWFYKNYWNAACDLILNNYDRLGISIPKDRLVHAKDSIFKENFDYTLSDYLDISDMLDKYFQSEQFSQPQVNELLASFDDNYLDERTVSRYFETDLIYKLIMPGKLLHADNAVIHHNTITWRLSAYRMTYGDYTIQATSRKLNVWVLALTGIIVLIAVGSFVRRGRG